MDTSVREKIRTFITSNFPVADPAALEDQTSLLDTGVVDSTGVLEVIEFIQEEFGIRVNGDEMEPSNLGSVANLVAYVHRKQG